VGLPRGGWSWPGCPAVQLGGVWSIYPCCTVGVASRGSTPAASVRMSCTRAACNRCMQQPGHAHCATAVLSGVEHSCRLLSQVDGLPNGEIAQAAMSGLALHLCKATTTIFFEFGGMALGGTHAGGRPPNYQVCRILLHVPQAFYKPFIHLYAAVVLCCMQMYGSTYISVQAPDPWLTVLDPHTRSHCSMVTGPCICINDC
jgi:hypothetical protein